eukprot:5000858-Amphidinium_carterae.1
MGWVRARPVPMPCCNNCRISAAIAAAAAVCRSSGSHTRTHRHRSSKYFEVHCLEGPAQTA